MQKQASKIRDFKLYHYLRLPPLVAVTFVWYSFESCSDGTSAALQGRNALAR